MSCKEIQLKLHEYLDGDLNIDEQIHLQEHLSQCPACKGHLFELEKTVHLIRALPRAKAPLTLVAGIMTQLPRSNWRKVWIRRLKQRPLLVAVSLFLILSIAGSILSWYEEGPKLRVLSSDKNQLRIENGAVYVPPGEVVEGDLVVEHGDLKVDGAVKGNVVVIDGKVLLSSTARISGNTEELHRLIDVLFYRLRSILQP